MNRISEFMHTSSTTATNVGSHVLAVPGKHEAAALTDMCPQCSVYGIEPASVLDVTKGKRITGRVATYQCTVCEACWLCHWGPPVGPNRVTAFDVLSEATGKPASDHFVESNKMTEPTPLAQWINHHYKANNGNITKTMQALQKDIEACALIRAASPVDRAKEPNMCTHVAHNSISPHCIPMFTGANCSSLDMHGSEPYCADVRFTVQAEGVHHA